MKKIYSLTFLLNLSLFFLLSCTNSPDGKHLERKEVLGVSANEPVVAKGQEYVSLNQKTIFSGQASMLIPVGFTLMDAEQLSLKYPKTGHQPSEVYTNKTGTINIAVNHTQNRARAEDLPEVKKAMEAQFNRPPIDFIQSEITQINGHESITMEFISPATDSEIYNLMLITSLNERLAIITFNCTEKYKREWESRGKEIIQSITIKKKSY